MSKFQYSFKLIPEKNMTKSFKYDSAYLSEKEYTDIVSWNNISFTDKWNDRISKQLYKKNRAMSDLIQFGELDNSCIVFWLKDNNINEVHVKFDVREVNNELISLLVDFAKDHESAVFTSDGNVLENDVSIIIEDIKKSDAYRSYKTIKI
jgi:hypothetical protein